MERELERERERQRVESVIVSKGKLRAVFQPIGERRDLVRTTPTTRASRVIRVFIFPLVDYTLPHLSMPVRSMWPSKEIYSSIGLQLLPLAFRKSHYMGIK